MSDLLGNIPVQLLSEDDYYNVSDEDLVCFQINTKLVHIKLHLTCTAYFIKRILRFNLIMYCI